MYGLVSRTTGVCGCPMCLSLSQYYAASIIITLQYNLKSGIVTFPEDLFFYFSVMFYLSFFSISGLNLIIIVLFLNFSVKKCVGVSIGFH